MCEMVSFAKGKARIFIWKRYRLIGDKKIKKEKRNKTIYIFI